MLAQIRSEFSCPTCGSIKLAPDYFINCSSSDTTAVISVTLLSQDQLPPRHEMMKVNINGTEVNGTFCEEYYNQSGELCIIFKEGIVFSLKKWKKLKNGDLWVAMK